MTAQTVWVRGRLVRRWQCCGQEWELLLSARYPDRATWRPTCRRCTPPAEELPAVPKPVVTTFDLAGQLAQARATLEVRSQELARLVKQARVMEGDANRELGALRKKVRRLRKALEAQQLDLFPPPEALEGLR